VGQAACDGRLALIECGKKLKPQLFPWDGHCSTGIQILHAAGDFFVTAVGTSLRHAAMMAFAVGAYSFLNSAMPILNREENTVWYLLSFPQSLSSILLKKAMVWAGIGLLYGGAVLFMVAHFSHHVHSFGWTDAFLALYGIVLYAFIASGIGVLATNVLETTPRARFRTDMVYLYMVLAGMWANTIYSPTVWTRLAQVVLSTLLAFALWQKVKDISPYLMDPTQHPPRTIGLADGMIAALAFFVVQNLIALILQWTVALSWAAQITISYTLAGVIVGCLTMLILWRQEIPGLWEQVGLARAVEDENCHFGGALSRERCGVGSQLWAHLSIFTC
jgi:ABC-2 type transport system permease protein